MTASGTKEDLRCSSIVHIRGQVNHIRSSTLRWRAVPKVSHVDRQAAATDPLPPLGGQHPLSTSNSRKPRHPCRVSVRGITVTARDKSVIRPTYCRGQVDGR